MPSSTPTSNPGKLAFSGPEPTSSGFSLTVSQTSIDALFSYEVSSEAFYNKLLQKPVWPGGESGVTIGIGYDLGCVSKDVALEEWKNFIPAEDVNKLAKVAGIKGIAAKNAAASLKNVSIPLAAAKNVFFQITLPQFARLARQTYPGIEELFADAQGALVSLLYNRGCSLPGNDRRKEMKAIKPLVSKADYAGIAEQLRQMKRLWNPATAGGLIKRREEEAKMIENANRNYEESELVRI